MIDLHTHSTFSDGSDSPTKLLESAAKQGLSALALTDHDTLAGLPEAQIAAHNYGVELVPGIELSCKLNGVTVHMLGYLIDPSSSELQEELALQQKFRANRNSILLEALNAASFELTLEEVVSFAGSGSVGKPHFAAALVSKGYVSSIDQAFTNILNNKDVIDVNRTPFSPIDAIDIIHAAQGVAVWAHPSRFEPVNISEIVPTLELLAAHGLNGIESYYSQYLPDTRLDLAKLASKYNLLATGGSDYHGTFKPALSLGTGKGDLIVSDFILNDLKSLKH